MLRAILQNRIKIIGIEKNSVSSQNRKIVDVNDSPDKVHIPIGQEAFCQLYGSTPNEWTSTVQFSWCTGPVSTITVSYFKLIWTLGMEEQSALIISLNIKFALSS